MDKVPLPTDNIYKFYALFGLVLFIFAVGATIALQRTTNDFMVQSLPDLEAIKAIEAPTSAERAKKALLEQQIDVAKSDKDFLGLCLALIAALGFWGAIYGFAMWHRKIQPIEDEMRKLQRDKLQLEVNALACAANPPPPNSSEIKTESLSAILAHVNGKSA